MPLAGLLAAVLAWRDMLIDTHIHLDYLERLPEALAEARAAGLGGWVVPGVAPAGWPGLMATVVATPGAWAAPGVHPQAAAAGSRSWPRSCASWQTIHGRWRSAKSAWTARPARTAAIQEEVFRQMIGIAREVGRPLLLHMRRAHRAPARTAAQPSGPVEVGGIAHAFSGSLETARQLIDLGFALGIGGVVTFPEARRLHQVVIARTGRMAGAGDRCAGPAAPSPPRSGEPAGVADADRGRGRGTARLDPGGNRPDHHGQCPAGAAPAGTLRRRGVTMTPSHRFSRLELLVGRDGLTRLEHASVAVFGLGGVGSFAAEALVRGGIGRLTLVDFDIIDITNLNRQLHALDGTVGRPKAQVMAERCRAINPAVQVEALQAFYAAENSAELLDRGYDYVLDCIDHISAKLHLIEACLERGLPVISSMGAANKLDSTQVRVADLAHTRTCRLARIIRRELRRRGIHGGLKVVFSTEEFRPLSGGRPSRGGRRRLSGTSRATRQLFGDSAAVRPDHGRRGAA